jgi:RNA polymerase sigma-70 factor (ECF subfamily)
VVVVKEVDHAVRAAEEARSFDAFYRAEYATVARLAFVLTGRRDLAEELAQDGFLACHQRWDRVSAFDDPGAWVRRVVTNRCVSSGRRHLTELRLLARLGRERPPELRHPTDGGELWASVRALPKRQAQCLALTFLEDRSVRDVAEILGIGEESVRTHLRRGRAAVATTLKEGSEDV